MLTRTDANRRPGWLLAAVGLVTCAGLGTTAQGFPGSQPAAGGAHTPSVASTATSPRTNPHQRLVNINTASRAELKTLPGIGDAEVERIVASRPYATKTHLVEKQALGLETYDKLQRLIVVDHRRAASRAKAPTP